HSPEENTPTFVVPVPSQSPTTGIAVDCPNPITLKIPPASFARHHRPLSKTPILVVAATAVVKPYAAPARAALLSAPLPLTPVALLSSKNAPISTVSPESATELGGT